MTSPTASPSPGSPLSEELLSTAQSSPLSNAQTSPLSPHDLSAAAILATLSESRPPTSHGEHDDEDLEDDDIDGGIALGDPQEYSALPAAGSLPHTPPATWLIPAQINDAWQTPGPGNMEVVQFPLDPHAAALETLSMAQPNPIQIPLHEDVTSWSQSAMTPVYTPNGEPDWDSDPYASITSNEQYLNLLNRDQFLPVTLYYKHFIASDDMELEDLSTPPVIMREDLQGDACDMQGICWDLLNATRETVRRKRANYQESHLTPALKRLRKTSTPNTENYFAFKRMNTRHQASVVHFQLRNLIAVTSRNDIFYADRDAVLRTDASGATPCAVLDLTKEMTEAGNFQITTLAAANDVVIAGGFEGEYALTSLSNTFGTPKTVGRIPIKPRDGRTHITNHLHIFSSRHNYTPQAILSSNDNRLRILDCHTNTLTHTFDFPQAVNCSATSPDSRLRVVVGDFRDTYITNAETGQIVETFDRAHADDAFACDWADDGIHVATAAQDSTINIYDARYWKGPLTTIYSELSIPRTLRFSPVGGGPRVLVAAEADDYLNIINAQTFESKQVFDYFGRLGGVSMTPDGSSLFLATSEPHFGGIMEFERCGWGESKIVDKEVKTVSWSETVMSDWTDVDNMDRDSNRRLVTGWHERQRRGLDLAGLVV
ncbi:hypothetical protein K491DRAFT_612266 [Lophiostoma macrostomum CBS 122681]|uniref:WD40 repeat-like protein n=1 Tax=Lophiostoma macrostomum CBS 122681 TaxID=1314788 RepID=A0A6A6SM68_9PLEO|nr:hypothetical protein K491DRAFT_612266 [Lophiostoma macrostomum CBS 122681]